MLILGVSDSHEAHACLVKNGKILAVMAEERLSRLKADMGYPRQAIDSVLRIAGVCPSDIDQVAFGALGFDPLLGLTNANATFSVRDWVALNHCYWRPLLFEGASLTALDAFDMFRDRNPRLVDSPYLSIADALRDIPYEHWNPATQAIRRRVIADHLGINPAKIRFFRHEDCHKAYGLYSAPSRSDASLVLTMEGGGDDSSATISTADAKGNLIEHWRSNAVMAGRLYRYVTLLLGMQPGQHEYKVMGLAPYGTEYHGRRSLEFFRKIHEIKGHEIINTRSVRDLYFTVKDALEGERFDGIAWGLQTCLEELLCQWVSNCVSEYNLSNVIMSGGVAQNIKACKRLAELPEVSRFWAGPISGDGSLGLGAAWLAHSAVAPEIPIEGLSTIYLGTSYTAQAVSESVRRHALERTFRLTENPSPQTVAQWIDRGLIVARFSGRMEFGQRALGNRSILADPRDPASVEKINQKIKYRDFWMPFTPSMTIEEADRLLHNPKGIYSPFMTMAFDLKPQYRNLIPAAQHPADKTVRPQMLRRNDNPAYYDLLTAFQKETGLGVLLNTSFNLHGEAIVETPDQAIDTFLRSEIDVLLFDTLAISRVKPSAP